MDFFEHQDRARQNTFLLTLFFALAVVLIIFAVYFVFVFVFSLEPSKTSSGAFKLGQVHFWNPDLFLWTTIGTLAIIVTGTFYKIAGLSTGGKAVARMLGAKLINPQTTHPAERRLLNVVEEMAIASGIPVPGVYVLEEECINAFAAGFSTRDAIVGVTRGCMNLLTRDELQAVIGHEFSHILNGDMGLNLRLMGILHGILVISLIGYFTIRIAGFSSSSSSGSARRKGGNPLVFIFLGICLMIIGYIGVFFARLIKSAISRQREFLADAASVQFTRNPDSMTSALKKIGGFIQGSRLTHPSAEEASHLFFADGLRSSLFNLMSTHPPLIQRIRRIDPKFDGTFLELSKMPAPSIEDEASPANAGLQRFAGYGRRDTPPSSYDSSQTVNLIGSTDAVHLKYISALLSALPPQFRLAAREPAGARALIMTLLLSRDKPIRNSQLEYIKNNADQETCSNVAKLAEPAENLPEEYFLPIIDLALAGIKVLPKSELTAFNNQLQKLIEADSTITLFEYMIQCLVRAQIKKAKTDIFGSSNIERFAADMTIILSTLAYYGKNNDQDAASAFAEGVKKLRLKQNLIILPRTECGLQQVDKALTGLNPAAPQVKKRFIDACSTCMAHDGKINMSEAQLLRAVAAMLDCPLPPFLPDA